MRSQLIRIQAEHLEKAGYIDDAVELLQKVVSDYPDTFDIAQVHHQLATCAERKGKTDEAVVHLRDALAAEGRTPNYKTRAWLTFGRIVAEHRLRDLYGEFLNLVRGQSQADLTSNTIFPVDRYLLSATLAIISEDQGEHAVAVEHAKAAIAAADLTHSGFRYHPHTGLVQEKDTPLYRSIRRMIE